MTPEQREELAREVHLLLTVVLRAMIVGVEQGIEQWKKDRKEGRNDDDRNQSD